MKNNPAKTVAVAGLASVAFTGAALALTLHEHTKPNAEQGAAIVKGSPVVGMVETEAVQLKRMEGLLAAHESGPIDADYCEALLSPLSGEVELLCKLTGFETVEEVYRSGWKVVSAVAGPLGSHAYVFIERAAPPKK